MRSRTLLIAVLFFAASTAIASDWPQWRGPDRTGVSKETGLLKSWPKEGPHLDWTVKGCGEGFSSIAVSKGVIYGTGLKDKQEYAWALKESDGSEIWSTPFAPDGQPGGPSKGPNSAPTVQNGKVYCLSSAGELACLDAANGKIVWHVNFKDKKGFDGRMMSGWGYSESVLIDGDKLICTPGGKDAALVALNANTGDVIWKCAISKDTKAAYASIVKTTVDGVPMYITVLDRNDGLVGVHAESGKLLWNYNKSDVFGGTAHIPTPIVKGDKIWVSTAYSGSSALLQLVVEGSEKVTVKELRVYKKQELMNHHGGMVLVGDYVYFGEGHGQGYPVCVDFKTGEIVWGPIKKNSEFGNGGGSAAVVAADGMLYFRYENAKVVLMEANPDGLKVTGSFEIPEKSRRESWQHPVIANGKLYLRDQDKLHCFNVKAK